MPAALPSWRGPRGHQAKLVVLRRRAWLLRRHSYDLQAIEREVELKHVDPRLAQKSEGAALNLGIHQRIDPLHRRPRALATRGTWKQAASGEISGSSPLRRGGHQIDRHRRRRILFLQRVHIALERSASALLVGPQIRAHGVDGVIWRVHGLGGVLRVGRIGRRRPAWKYLSPAKTCPISAEPTTLPSLRSGCPCAWRGKMTSRDAGHGERIGQAGDRRQQHENDDGRTDFFQHGAPPCKTRCNAVTNMSIALMPMNGSTMPPSP